MAKLSTTVEEAQVTHFVEAEAEAPRVVNGEVTNPGEIAWPFDPWGFTTILRKEGVRAVGRIKADEEKLAILMGTLRCIAQHAQSKIEDQKADNEQSAIAEGARVEQEYARSLAEQEREVERLKTLLAHAEADVAAKIATE